MTIEIPPDCLLARPEVAIRTLNQAIKDGLNPIGTWVEFGMFRGGSLRLWKQVADLYNCEPNMIGVDPYIVGTFSPGEDVEAFMEVGIARLKQFHRWQFYRMKAQDWLSDYAKRFEGQISFALVDGSHETYRMLIEIELLIPLLSQKAFVIVDDIHNEPNFPDRYEQIAKALNKLCEDKQFRWIPQKGKFQQAYLFKNL